MNEYLKRLQKLEFVLTDACTGACKHCSQGDHARGTRHLSPELAVRTVKELSAVFSLRTVMVFGGEPLLYPDDAGSIIAAARDARIPHRQIITNGCFTKNENEMRRVARLLGESGVNDLLLSVDAFHQESLPLEQAHLFARLAREAGIPLRLQPAWLVSREDRNGYNQSTRAILTELERDGFCIAEGNIIFPEGNAKKYLSSYFTFPPPPNPYEEDPRDLHTLSVDADGTVLGQSLYEKSVLEIVASYRPHK
ncbi:MAG: radical SAM protein [Ruminococcaceae bacterium]|nr:radical SAM protein [Oscillospiraceae bacterium]